MKKKPIEMSIKDHNEFIEGADITCMYCAYATVRNCNKCPVRKTLDRVKRVEEVKDDIHNG